MENPFDASGDIRAMLKRSPKSVRAPERHYTRNSGLNMVCRGDMHIVVLPVTDGNDKNLERWLDMIFKRAGTETAKPT